MRAGQAFMGLAYEKKNWFSRFFLLFTASVRSRSLDQPLVPGVFILNVNIPLGWVKMWVKSNAQRRRKVFVKNGQLCLGLKSERQKFTMFLSNLKNLWLYNGGEASKSQTRQNLSLIIVGRLIDDVLNYTCI